jgi:hypothetical protein
MQRNKDNIHNKKIITNDNQKDKSIFSKVYILFIVFFLFCLVQVFIWINTHNYEHHNEVSNKVNNDIKNQKKSTSPSPFRDKSMSNPVMKFDIETHKFNNNNKLVIDKPKVELNNILKILDLSKVKNEFNSNDINASKLEVENIINSNKNNNNYNSEKKRIFSDVSIDKTISKIKISKINKYNYIANRDVVMPDYVPTTWNEFLKIPLKSPNIMNSNYDMKPFSSSFKPNICSESIIKNLNEPLLTMENKTFCTWAMTVGGVIVGKSWGSLKNVDKVKFDELNCNSFSKGYNPNCNDKWGMDISNYYLYYLLFFTNNNIIITYIIY